MGRSVHEQLPHVGQAIVPADALSSASRRRLKAGGSQEWLPHKAEHTYLCQYVF